MPTLRKLAPEEVQAIENKGTGTRKLAAQQYDGFLSGYEVGDYGEAQLDAGEKRLTVRNRLKAAAGRRDVGIEFKRTAGGIIRFKIVEHTNGAARSKPVRRVPDSEYQPVASDAPPKRKPGRPRKTG